VVVSANKFHWIVPKMRQVQTFLATFKIDPRCHENVGRNFNFGAAYDFRRCLYGPVADERATGRSAQELTLAVGAGVRSEPLGGDNAFGGSIPSAHKRAGGFLGFPCRNADFGRLTFRH
jgi:hypothetical protein